MNTNERLRVLKNIKAETNYQNFTELTQRIHKGQFVIIKHYRLCL